MRLPRSFIFVGLIMDEGYIKLYRQLLDSRVWANEGLLKVWLWCLLRANHKDTWITIKTGRGETEVEVKKGQFIFGRKSAGKSLKMPPSTVWKRILKLENIQNLNTESNTHYTLISIVNWDTYQCEEKKGDTESDRQGTPKEQPRNTDKNDKKDKKEKTFLSDSEEIRLSNFLFNHILRNNPDAKKPNFQRWAKDFDAILRIDKRDLEDVKSLIKWSQTDSFWKANILSPGKLRDKFDQLTIKSKETVGKTETEIFNYGMKQI